jgi:hypothetical protein
MDFHDVHLKIMSLKTTQPPFCTIPTIHNADMVSRPTCELEAGVVVPAIV